MLLNDFFKIKNIEQNENYSIQIELNPHHTIYKGHFPGTPITPGVCLTQMVKETVEHITQKSLLLVTGDNIKFTAILNPLENPLVTLTLTLKTKENGNLHADSRITNKEINFFSFKGSFKEN